jgi:sterol desaturase/sphingolipid hydroxylase (fatty acid hydroxylase superfamily)
MHLNYLAFAIPLFISLMIAEYIISCRKNQQHFFSLEEVIANINVGIAERLSDLFTTGSFYFAFVWLHKNLALLTVKPTITNWILLFIFTDFIWYWYHRFGHQVNLFWSVHVVPSK